MLGKETFENVSVSIITVDMNDLLKDFALSVPFRMENHLLVKCKIIQQNAYEAAKLQLPKPGSNTLME
jgi:hypothetical protein